MFGNSLRDDFFLGEWSNDSSMIIWGVYNSLSEAVCHRVFRLDDLSLLSALQIFRCARLGSYRPHDPTDDRGTFCFSECEDRLVGAPNTVKRLCDCRQFFIPFPKKCNPT